VPHAHRITVVSIVINATLFILKLVAGMFAGSLAIMADATNSLLDTMYSIGVYWSVGESHKKADKGHPFGHGRAEPMVAFVISILMAIAAFEFLRSSTLNIFQGGAGTQSISMVVVAALLIAIVAKIFLSTECYHAGKKSRSPALLAVAADSRNDVLITMIALAGFIFSTVGFPLSDDFAALVISLFLFHEAYKIGKKNFDYLLGAAPPKELELMIREATTHVRGVRGIHKIRAHYVGSYVHAEIHILVNPRITTAASHKIAMSVQHDVEHLKEVNKAFIHVEPA
jgi:cation diffusion facilitator family transporter